MRLSKVFEDIIDLDRQNFVQVRGNQSGLFDERSLREILIKEHFDDRLLIFLYHEEVLISYLRLFLMKENLLIKSFQMRNGYQYALFEMLRRTHERLSNLDFEVVTSEIYEGNNRALKFNKKLGLRVTESNNGKLYLSTSKQIFLDSMKRYVRSNSKNSFLA
jgi:hypothetical protein